MIYAIVLTFFALELRVSEWCGVKLKTTDLARRTTRIKRNRQKEKELVPLPASIVSALRGHIQHRGSQAGLLSDTRPANKKAARRRARNATLCCASLVNSGNASACTRLVSPAAQQRHHSGARRRRQGRDRVGPGEGPQPPRAIATLLIYADQHDREALSARCLISSSWEQRHGIVGRYRRPWDGGLCCMLP